MKKYEKPELDVKAYQCTNQLDASGVNGDVEVTDDFKALGKIAAGVFRLP